jgi:hypothetical protein
MQHENIVLRMHTALAEWLPEAEKRYCPDGYYSVKLQSNTLLGAVDWAIINALSGRTGLKIVEAGAGYAQLSFFLSVVYGFETRPFELADNRFAGCLMLKELLGDAAQACIPVNAVYPDGYSPEMGSILISTNTINGQWLRNAATEELRWKKHLSGIVEAFIDVERTGQHRDTPEKLEAALKICADLGYKLDRIFTASLSDLGLYHMVLQ